MTLPTPIPPLPPLCRGDVVHVLRFGIAQCRTVAGLPHQWPARHSWVRAETFKTIPLAYRCPHCKGA